MKKLFQLAAFVAVATVLAATTPFARAAAGDVKIATVDLQKVFDKYYKTVRSNQALQLEASDMEKERKSMVDSGKKQEGEWQKLIEKSEDQAISADERARSKKAAEEKFRDVKSAEESIQEYDRAAGTKLREKRRQRTDDILKEIRGVLDAQAKAAGYTLVLDTSGESANMAPVVLYSNGANDMTDALIKELNAGAPPTAADDTSSKPAK
jgi:Skp family chaperone for outer membrane proteins